MRATSDFFRPINVINLLIGILGLSLGYYFFKASQPTVQVAYVYNTELVAQLDDPRFTLSKEGELLPVRSLYRTTIAIWNAGSAPIEPGAVRRPLTVEFSPNVQVIDAKIEKISHNVSSAGLSNNSSKLEIDWKYFDPGFYFILQLYQSSDDSPQVSLRYIGDKEIVTQFPKRLVDTWYFTAVSFFIAIFIMALAFSVGAWLSTKAERYLESRGRRVFGVPLSPKTVGFVVFMSVTLALALGTL